ncbi:MAG: 2-dehydropantoate 2-reductase [Clostridia bacterium]|nr:2-dehydropantoate 2-reductase [Clostridia bacterium]
MRNKRICVAGIGGIGGLLSAMLGQVCRENLSVYTRGAKAEKLRENGLVLHSEFYGEKRAPARVCTRAEEVGEQDLVIICVKNYSLEQVAEELRPCIRKGTILLPVLNGVDSGDRLRRLFPEAVVCDAVIYTISAANPDGSVTQTGPYTHMFVGSREKDELHQRCARETAELFLETGFDCRFTENIEGEIWQKFVLNCAFNTMTARHRKNIGDIREKEEMRREIRALLEEAYRAGIAEGVQLPEDLVEIKYNYVMHTQPGNSTSSMARDVEAHRPIELEAFTGTVLRISREHGLSAPVTREYHEALSALTEKD